MKQSEKRAIALAIGIFFFVAGYGQICVQETFDTDTSISDTANILKWSVTDSSQFGISLPTLSWRADGKASGGDYWGPRERIDSPSGGGAAVFNADSVNVNVTGEPTFQNIYLISPEISMPNPPTSPVFLSFYQYYRNLNASATVEISVAIDSGFYSPWMPIDSNKHIGRNVETANDEKVVIDLTPYLEPDGWATYIRVRFHFKGDNYFWILDDISICEGVNPGPETKPVELGEYLSAGHTYQIDSLCNPFVPDELVVEFLPGTPDSVKMNTRDSLGVDSFVVCKCNPDLELWIYGIKPVDGPDTPSVLGAINTSIFERAKATSTKSNLHGDDVSFNYYTYGDIGKQDPFPFLPYTPLSTSPPDSNDVIVAHLDSGIDYNQWPELASRIWKNNNSIYYPNDSVGHNFVSDNNNVLDDHGHGTRTALLMTGQLPALNCPFKIMPLKTHDNTGVGTLFNNSCALYYALKEGADVVLLPWGWKGKRTDIPKRAIDSLYLQRQAIVVNAAGNFGLNLDITQVYPTAYNSPNLVTVGGLVQTGNNTFVHSPISNYSGNVVEIGTIGENIVFPADTGAYSGTSYAAPPVAATIAALLCQSRDSVQNILHQLYECADEKNELEPYIIDGRALDLGFSCLIPPTVTGQLVYALTRYGHLISFDSDVPGIVRSVVRIGGIDAGEVLSGIDFRPATRVLYALGYNPATGAARLYTVDLASGAATPVGAAPLALKSGMGKVSMDFNPVSDLVRVTGSDNSNFRVHPVTGDLAGADSDLAFAAGDLHSGANASIGAVAYGNSIEGATATALYAYDDSLNVLATLAQPGNGMLQTIGTTGISVNLSDPSADMDIYFDPLNGVNTAYLSANTDAETADNFYTLDLATGAATLVGKIGGGVAITDIAVALEQPERACETKVIGCIKYEILSITADSSQDKTYRIRVTNNCTNKMIYTAFGLPKGVVAEKPANNSVYVSANGHSYDVRNASFSPFYSVRFKEQGDGIVEGQADVFEYTLPAYADPDFIHVQTQVGSREVYNTYLNVSACTVVQSAFHPGIEERSGASGIASKEVRIFPNPTGGVLYADLAAWQNEQVRIQLLNSQGQQIQNTTLTARAHPQIFELPQHLPNGLYFIEMTTEKGEKRVERFVLQH